MNVTRTFATAAATIATAGAAFFGGLSTGASAADEYHLANDGVCVQYSGAVTVYSCAPLVSPNGAAMVGRVEEDGSAAYSDGTVYDAETATFA